MQVFFLISGLLIAILLVVYGSIKLLKYLFRLDLEADSEMTSFKD